jgi:hypothetical protein
MRNAHRMLKKALLGHDRKNHPKRNSTLETVPKIVIPTICALLDTRPVGRSCSPIRGSSSSTATSGYVLRSARPVAKAPSTSDRRLPTKGHWQSTLESLQVQATSPSGVGWGIIFTERNSWLGTLNRFSDSASMRRSSRWATWHILIYSIRIRGIHISLDSASRTFPILGNEASGKISLALW